MTPHRVLFWSDDHLPQDHVGATALYPKQAVKAVVTFLKGGRVHGTTAEPQPCLICGAELGQAEMTDGELVWPQNAQHYVSAHKVWSNEHAWLAERIVLHSDEPPPEEVGSDRSVAIDNPDPATTDASDLWVEMAAQELLGEHQVPDTPFMGEDMSPEDYDTMDTDSDDEPPSDPWAMSEDKVDAMVDASLAGEAPRVHRRRSPAARRRSSRRPVSSPAHRRRRRVISPSGAPGPVHAANRPTRDVVDAEAVTGEDVHTEASSPSTALVATSRPEDSPVSPSIYGATNFASQISKAYPQVSAALAAKIVEVAGLIGAHPYDLANLIHFESGKTFRPDVKHPSSGATGLIQFYPGLTKRNLGVTVDQLARLTDLQQMEWVRTYFDKVRGGQPLDTPNKVAMAVFYPKALGWAPTQQFPANVTQNNPGIYTPNDYAALMHRIAQLPPSDHAPQFTAGANGAGLWGDFTSWLRRITGGGAAVPVAPPTAVQPPTPTAGTWQADPSLTVRLVGGNGQVFGPGQLPSGNYQVELWSQNQWVPLAPVQVAAGARYRVYVQQGHLQWAQEP